MCYLGQANPFTEKRLSRNNSHGQMQAPARTSSTPSQIEWEPVLFLAGDNRGNSNEVPEVLRDKEAIIHWIGLCILRGSWQPFKTFIGGPICCRFSSTLNGLQWKRNFLGGANGFLVALAVHYTYMRRSYIAGLVYHWIINLYIDARMSKMTPSTFPPSFNNLNTPVEGLKPLFWVLFMP